MRVHITTSFFVHTAKNPIRHITEQSSLLQTLRTLAYEERYIRRSFDRLLHRLSVNLLPRCLRKPRLLRIHTSQSNNVFPPSPARVQRWHCSPKPSHLLPRHLLLPIKKDEVLGPHQLRKPGRMLQPSYHSAIGQDLQSRLSTAVYALLPLMSNLRKRDHRVLVFHHCPKTYRKDGDSRHNQTSC